MSKTGYGGSTPKNVGQYICKYCQGKEHDSCLDVTRMEAGFEGRLCTCKNKTCLAQFVPSVDADSQQPSEMIQT